MDLCLCLCLPHIGVLRPEGVFLSLGVLLPLCSLTGPVDVDTEMFSSDTECSPDKNSSSGSGESLSNSSTEGVSAPGGRWNHSDGNVPSLLLIVSLNRDSFT